MYRYGAEQGFREAKYNLGICFLRGRRVESSFIKAIVCDLTMLGLQVFFGNIKRVPRITRRGLTVIYNRRNKLNFEGRYRPAKKTGSISKITAMLDLLGVESRYFQKLLGIDAYSFSSLADDLPTCLWVHDEYHSIVYDSKRFMANYGSCAKRTCYEYLMGEKKPCICCLARRSFASNKPQRCKFCKRNEFGYELNSFHTPITNKYGNRFIMKSSFHVDDVETSYDIYFD